MEICSICGKLKDLAGSCADYRIRIKGQLLQPLRYTTKKPTPFNKEDIQMRCPSCCVKPGGYHHVGCSIEICPQCGGRWIFCSCQGTKEVIDDLSDKKCMILGFPSESTKKK